MIIYIDGDACPVIEITKKICKEKGLSLKVVKDYNHYLNLDYGEVITLDQGNDFADLYIANLVTEEDLVITNDIGLASLILAKDSSCMNYNGDLIDEANIDYLLFSRHIGKQNRRAGKYGKGPRKRKPEDDLSFESGLRRFLEG